MLFWAFKKGFGGYEYQVQVNVSSINKAKQKLTEQGYTGKWILVPTKNIINLSQNPTQNL